MYIICILLGMDIIIAALVGFTAEYCKGVNNNHQKPIPMYAILIGDVIQLLLNPVYGHAFDVESIILQGKPYFVVVPGFGQMIHRVVDYSMFFCVLIIFVIAAVRTAKIYRERYTIILAAMIINGVWETFYILTRTPIDRSMIGFAVFGLLVFYLSIYYRPLRLLDKMLSGIATDMSDGLFLFDELGKCIWASKPGLKLIGIDDGNLDYVSAALNKKFGERNYSSLDCTVTTTIGSRENTLYYTIENHSVNENKEHIAGSYLAIYDKTEEHLKIERDMYNSTHDSLTDLLTKQYLYECVKNILRENKETEFVSLLLDVKN